MANRKKIKLTAHECVISVSYHILSFYFGCQLMVGEETLVPSISFMDYVPISNLRVVLPKPNLAGINKNIFGRENKNLSVVFYRRGVNIFYF